MSAYTITQGSLDDRTAVERWLPCLDLVSPQTREKIVTAWISAWRSSPYPTLEELPYSTMAPSYRLERHVPEVALLGWISRGARAASGEQRSTTKFSCLFCCSTMSINP